MNERKFTMIYNDVLEGGILTNPYQIALYVCLKKYTDKNNQCFPSAATLSKMTGMCRCKVITTLKALEKKGIISIQNRYREDGGKTSNLYTIHDDTPMNTNTEPKKKKVFSKPKKKNTATKTKPKNNYSMDVLKSLYKYDELMQENPDQKQEIDSAMNIIHDTVNTSKPTIRISGENKPKMVVIAKLLKLTKESILYAIQKVKEQAENIKNPVAYLLTVLFKANEQRTFDCSTKLTESIQNNDRPKNQWFQFQERQYSQEEMDKLERALLNRWTI